jgi:hypothetical protein
MATSRKPTLIDLERVNEVLYGHGLRDGPALTVVWGGHAFACRSVRSAVDGASALWDMIVRRGCVVAMGSDELPDGAAIAANGSHASDGQAERDTQVRPDGGSDLNQASPTLSEPAAVASIRREELARYLRMQRSRIRPEDAGLSDDSRRRVPGLRRYEVAQLSGVSDTWYTWLEQARDIKVSSEALDSVARALKLDEHGRRHVRRLAGIPVVDPEPAASPHWRPEYEALLDQLLPWPASISTVAADLVAWNRAYAFLVLDPGTLPDGRRNVLWALFNTSLLRQATPQWQRQARGVVARFQFESGNYPDDPRFAELVNDLSEHSPEFREFWNSGQIRPFSDESDIVYEHPIVGTLNLRKLQARMIDRPRLVLTMHQAADNQTRQRLEQLLNTDHHDTN